MQEEEGEKLSWNDGSVGIELQTTAVNGCSVNNQ